MGTGCSTQQSIITSSSSAPLSRKALTSAATVLTSLVVAPSSSDPALDAILAATESDLLETFAATKAGVKRPALRKSFSEDNVNLSLSARTEPKTLLVSSDDKNSGRRVDVDAQTDDVTYKEEDYRVDSSRTNEAETQTSVRKCNLK
jgi:hypothetical protein